ncbi:MAG: acyltransferase [Pseudoramibacter sp.]
MECTEERVDMRLMTPEERAEGQRQTELLFKINHTLPFSEEYKQLLFELFGDNLGENSMIAPPFNGACVGTMKIGKDVFINSNLLAMARGGVTIEEHVMIAANAQIITNNHDPYDLQILTCRPILIKDHAWIGAGATILPGVCVGRHAVVGAGAVVTKDVPDFAVVVGSPAKVIKTLDRNQF